MLKTLKLTFLSALSLVIIMSPGLCQEPAVEFIQSNNIKARVSSDGLLFFGDDKGFEFPKNQRSHLMNSSGLWIAGLDEKNNLRGAIQKYNEDGKRDFRNDENWNKIWRISRADIEKHIADYSDNQLINEPIQIIYSWPSKGNEFFMDENGFELPNDSEEFAPFVDSNNNDLYEPHLGEYPEIDLLCNENPAPLPDEMLWFRYSDRGSHTQSDLLPIGVEIFTSVFVFNCTNSQILRNTLFVRHWISSKYPENLTDTYMGIFADFDIGCPMDDFMGSSYNFQTIYGYNSDNEDWSCVEGIGYELGPPAMAVTLIKPPWTFLNLAVIPVYMTNMIPVGYGSGFDGEPQTGLEHYNYMRGIWKDGTTMPYNARFYEGNPNTESNTEAGLGNMPGDRRAIGVMGPFDLRSRAFYEVVVAYSAYDSAGNNELQNVQEMYNGLPLLLGNFEDCYSVCEQMTTNSEDISISKINVFPNPVSNVLHVESTEQVERFELINELGQIEKQSVELSNEFTLRITDQESGIYFLKLYFKNAVAIKKLIIGS